MKFEITFSVLQWGTIIVLWILIVFNMIQSVVLGKRTKKVGYYTKFLDANEKAFRDSVALCEVVSNEYKADPYSERILFAIAKFEQSRGRVEKTHLKLVKAQMTEDLKE